MKIYLKILSGIILLAALMTVVLFHSFSGSVYFLPGLASSVDSGLLGFSWSQPASVLSKGKFLVASREIKDPSFMETVVLLLDFRADGAIGLVINRRTDVKLSTLLPNVKGLKHLPDTAYIGGPVNEGTVFLLVRDKTRSREFPLVFEDVYVTSSLSALNKILETEKLRENFHAYVGYAGWAAGQLEREVSNGQWHVMQADAGTIFSKKPSGVWRELIARATAQWVKEIHKKETREKIGAG